jgi:hypothetical protein
MKLIPPNGHLKEKDLASLIFTPTGTAQAE